MGEALTTSFEASSYFFFLFVTACLSIYNLWTSHSLARESIPGAPPGIVFKGLKMPTKTLEDPFSHKVKRMPLTFRELGINFNSQLMYSD